MCGLNLIWGFPIITAVMGLYRQYVSHIIAESPTQVFLKVKQEQRNVAVGAILSHWSSALLLTAHKGIEDNCQWVETASFVLPLWQHPYPAHSGMGRPESITGKFAFSLFSHNMPSVLWLWCKPKSRGRGGSRVYILVSKTKDQGPHYGRFVQLIWLEGKISSHQCQYCPVTHVQKKKKSLQFFCKAVLVN